MTLTPEQRACEHEFEDLDRCVDCAGIAPEIIADLREQLANANQRIVENDKQEEAWQEKFDQIRARVKKLENELHMRNIAIMGASHDCNPCGECKRIASL